MGVMVGFGCVTVNVNFPEGAVQRAADDYVSELYRAKEQSKKSDEKPAPPALDKSSLWHRMALIQVAHAQVAGFTTDTPGAKQIQERQRGRLATIDDYKRRGVIGEVLEGLIGIKDAGALKPIEKKRVENLVQDENKDRESLYADIAEANKMNETGARTIRKTFSDAFLKASPAGTFYLEGGAWKRK
jgi:uncharacterized protein YdbL (DUF1318 family)